jgi:hypothetical protein
LIMGHSHYHQGWGEGGEVQWKIKRYCTIIRGKY